MKKINDEICFAGLVQSRVSLHTMASGPEARERPMWRKAGMNFMSWTHLYNSNNIYIHSYTILYIYIHMLGGIF